MTKEYYSHAQAKVFMDFERKNSKETSTVPFL